MPIRICLVFIELKIQKLAVDRFQIRGRRDEGAFYLAL
jgi:hypothetical protein